MSKEFTWLIARRLPLAFSSCLAEPRTHEFSYEKSLFRYGVTEFFDVTMGSSTVATAPCLSAA